MNSQKLEFDISDERNITRLHLNLKMILVNHFTGVSSIKRNAISDRFDDLHQEFIVTFSSDIPQNILDHLTLERQFSQSKNYPKTKVLDYIDKHRGIKECQKEMPNTHALIGANLTWK